MSSNRRAGAVVRATSAPRAVRISRSTLEELDRADLARRFEEGVQEGLRRSREAGGGAPAAAADRLDEARESALAELSRTSVDLAVRIASVLLKVELDAGHYDIEKIVRSSLSWSGVGRGACTVHLHPQDVARLTSVPMRKLTEVEADPEITPGNCHVTTPQGVLVRDVEECLVAIREKLLGAADESGTDERPVHDDPEEPAP